MYKTECFYSVEKKTKKAKDDDKGKESDNEEDDSEEEVVSLKKEKKLNEKSKTYRIFHIYWLMQKQIEHYNKNKSEYNIKIADKFTREFSLLPHKQNFTISNLHLTNTNLFGNNSLVNKFGCSNKKVNQYLETFFNLEKMNTKINKSFCKKPLDKRDVMEKKYNLKSIYTDGYSCSLVFEKNIDSQMIVKRKEKALEDSTPKIKKITKAIKKIVPKKKKSSKNKSDGDDDDIWSI